jgi:hypothetical protein
MERPSHIVFAAQSRSRRLPWIGLAISLQAAVVWLFVHGLVSGTIHLPPGPIELTPNIDPQKPIVKPPEPVLITVPKPTVVDPIEKRHDRASW